MGGGEISGFYEPDRFVMGLLRSLADVVLVGAGTMRATPTHRWVPEHVSRAFAGDFAELRSRLGLSPQPRTAIVTASGEIDLGHPGVSDPAVPVLILTTDRGATRLTPHAPHVDVFSFGSSPPTAEDIVELLARRGAELVLTEGGPHLMGQLLSAGLLDELFLTIAPQIAGRDATLRGSRWSRTLRSPSIARRGSIWPSFGATATTSSPVTRSEERQIEHA